jgi:hypothetical protein
LIAGQRSDLLPTVDQFRKNFPVSNSKRRCSAWLRLTYNLRPR